MKTWSILLLVMTFPLLAQAQNYRNPGGQSRSDLASREGLKITITAQNFSSGIETDTQTDTAEQIQITATGSNLRSNSKVRAVLTSNCVSAENHWPVSEPTLTADLTGQTAGSSLEFTGGPAGALVTNYAMHGGDWYNCTPQISVVVDGVWQTDPVNGTHNFNLINF